MTQLSSGEALTPEEEGVLVGAFLLGDPGALEVVAAPRIREAAALWRALPRHELAARLADAVRLLLTGAGALERLHPSWIVEALADEPPEVVRAILTPAAGAADGSAKEVARMLLVGLEELWNGAPGPCAAPWLAMSFAELEAAVTRRGARLLGVTLAGASAPTRARAMAAVGAPWAGLIGQAAAEEHDPEALARARRAVSSAAVLDRSEPADRLAVIGASDLRDELAGEGEPSVRLIAGRLPAWLARRAGYRQRSGGGAG